MIDPLYDYSPFDRQSFTGQWDFTLGDKIALNHLAAELGWVRWNNLLEGARTRRFPSKDYFRDLLSFIDIGGRPVEAFIRTHLADLPERADIGLFVQVEEAEPRAANPRTAKAD